MAEPAKTLPDAEVNVSSREVGSVHKVDLTVSRPGANRGEPKTFNGESTDRDRATADAVKKLLREGHEFVGMGPSLRPLCNCRLITAAGRGHEYCYGGNEQHRCTDAVMRELNSPL